MSKLLQIFYAEPPKGAEHKELPKEAPKNLRPLLHPHMNIVYITILLLAVSDKIPSHLDFLKSKLLLVIIRRAGPRHPTKGKGGTLSANNCCKMFTWMIFFK